MRPERRRGAPVPATVSGGESFQLGSQDRKKLKPTKDQRRLTEFIVFSRNYTHKTVHSGLLNQKEIWERKLGPPIK